MYLTDQSNLSDLFLGRVADSHDAPAFRQFDGQQWRDWSWGEVAREVGRWQAALLHEGLKPGDRVALCLHNRVEWVIFDQAALGLGLVTVPLYFDDRPDNMAWCLNDAGVRLLLLEDGAQWLTLKDRVRTVGRAVCLGGTLHENGRAVLLSEWLPPDGVTIPARSTATPDELASIIYTSGTTGRPKGVMLSHRNILSNVVAGMKRNPLQTSDRALSFLPLSHTFERTVGYYCAVLAGGQTVYARSITQLAEDIASQKPTILVAVPRIFERIWARMQEQMPAGSSKRRLFEQAVETGWRRFQGTATFADKLLWPLLETLVAKKLYRRLGGRIRLIAVGGAALPPELARIFVGLGLPIVQGYGLTESSPILTGNSLTDNDPTSVGRALDGVRLRVAQNGELLACGPNIMLGYWNNPLATQAAIDADGWLHTGDLARMQDGRVYITGRMKEIIVLSNGEKVPPEDAEHAILRDPVFEQVMLIGEGRPKLGLVCVTQLSDRRELCERANAQLREFPGYARIAHIARVEGPWSVDNGLLTPKLSMKRKEIERRFAKEIESMYATTILSIKQTAHA